MIVYHDGVRNLLFIATYNEQNMIVWTRWNEERGEFSEWFLEKYRKTLTELKADIRKVDICDIIHDDGEE